MLLNVVVLASLISTLIVGVGSVDVGIAVFTLLDIIMLRRSFVICC